MVQRTHQEDPAALAVPPLGDLEPRALQDHRARDDEEQAADEHEQQLGAAQDREGGERAAEAERAGVAHDDLRGVRVPPQEADERAGDRRGDDREVERIAHVVALVLDVGIEVRGCEHHWLNCQKPMKM